MTASNLFAYDKSGSVIVIGDGSEILAHSGADESPLWRATCDDSVVALGATGDTVFAVFAAREKARLSRWGARDGQPGQSVDLDGAPRGLAVGERGLCAVVLANSVALVARGVLSRTITVEKATAAALSGDETKLAIGSADGLVRVYSISGDGGAGDAASGQIDIGVPVRSLAWSPGGFWFATGGDRVLRVEGDASASQQVTRATGMTPDCVACSEDGSLLALRLDPSTVVALAYPSRDTAATVQYIDKRVVGVAFGPAPFFGIGLTGGDGNKINLRTEAVHRTDTHPGRTHNRWMLSSSIEAKALPKEYAGALAAPPKKDEPRRALRAGYPDDDAQSTVPAKGGSVGVIVAGLAFLILAVVLFVARCQ